jgi:hypothetical protein
VSLEGTGLRQDTAATSIPVKARSNEASGRLGHLHLQNVTFSSEPEMRILLYPSGFEALTAVVMVLYYGI